MIRCHELSVTTRSGKTLLHPLSFDLPDGASLFLVGESGSGKSSFLEAVAGISLHVVSGWAGSPPELADELRSGAPERRATEEAEASQRRRRRAERRGSQLPGTLLAVQEPATAFSPYRRLAAQWRDVKPLARASERRGAEILPQLGLDLETLQKFPHECSGGMLRRVIIAAVLAARPAVVLLDEPTGGVDPSRRWAVLETVRRYAPQFIVATHDMGLVGRLETDYLLVLKDGRAVEFGPAATVISDPQEAYTRRLLEVGGR